MLKYSLIYLLMSIFVVLFSKYIHIVIIYIDFFYTYIIFKLAPVFSPTPAGVMIRNVLSLVLIPTLIAAIPAGIYRIAKGRMMPYTLELIGFLWLVIVLSKVLIQ